MTVKPSRFFWIILLALLTACGQVSPEATPTATLTSLPPTVTSIPAITSTPESRASEPPACTFPLAQTTMEESKPETYTFSEPVIAANSNSGIELVEWLPDSQRILITRRIHNTSNENIELLDPVTGETQVYAVRTGNMWFRPVWVENLKSVIYSDWLLVSSPTYNNGMVVPTSIVGRQQLMLTAGNPDNAQILEDVQYTKAIVPHAWVTSSLAVKPDSSQIVYLKINGETPWHLYSSTVYKNELQLEQQSVIQGSYGGEGVWLESNKMTWRTASSQIFFYSLASATDQTFLLDIDSGQVCSLSFGGWVYFARWSPNGRYLAVIKSAGPKFPLNEDDDLVVLDTATGVLYPLDATKIGPSEMRDCCIHIVEDIAWAPDNRHLAIIGTATFSGPGTQLRHDRLYLFDFLSGEVDNLFPSYPLISNYSGSSLAWSPDGSKILTTCPTEKEGRLCLIPVHVVGD